MFKLFSDTPIEKSFMSQMANIEKAVDAVSVSDLGKYEALAIASNIATKHEISPLSVDTESVTKNSYLRSVQGKYFPSVRSVDKNEYYDCVSVSYTYNISGSVQLLDARPTTRTFQHNVNADFDNNKLVIVYNSFFIQQPLTEPQKAEVREYLGPIHNDIAPMVEAINKDVDSFNSQIVEHVSKLIENKKKSLDDKRKHDNEL